MNKRMALAQKKLAQDQQKVKNILRRIKKVKTEDVIPNVQGARAEYDVDVRNDVTRQVWLSSMRGRPLRSPLS